MQFRVRLSLMRSTRTIAWFCVMSITTMATMGIAAQQAEPAAVKSFGHAEYFHATASGQKKAAPAVKGSLSLNGQNKTLEFLDKAGEPVASVSYSAIKAMFYEQTSKPRYAAAVLISPMFLLSHSKKHYLTVQYTNKEGSGEYLIVHLDKSNAREAIAATQAETGKDVERTLEK
jgi:hypothetical protein